MRFLRGVPESAVMRLHVNGHIDIAMRLQPAGHGGPEQIAIKHLGATRENTPDPRAEFRR